MKRVFQVTIVPHTDDAYVPSEVWEHAIFKKLEIERMPLGQYVIDEVVEMNDEYVIDELVEMNDEGINHD